MHFQMKKICMKITFLRERRIKKMVFLISLVVSAITIYALYQAYTRQTSEQEDYQQKEEQRNLNMSLRNKK